MAGLSDEQIKKLLAKKPATGKGRKPKGYIDTSSRDVETWFKLGHMLFDNDDPDKYARCQNPDCVDPRHGERQLVAVVNGERMCRYCFLEGYLMVAPEQAELPNAD